MKDVQSVEVALAAPPLGPPEAVQTPTRQVSLGFMLSLTAGSMALYLLYAGIGALLLPYQIGLLDPANKVVVLAIFTGFTVLVALFANPIAGALSDRTTSRFGRRRPWIFVGGLMTMVSVLFMWHANNLIFLFIGYCGVELFSNCALATILATIPDQVPETQRGAVSGIFGLGLPLGGILGAVLVGQIFKNAPTNSYPFIFLIVLVTTIPLALFLPDKVLPRGYMPPFHLGTFFKSFWINPRKHPDFGWAWLTRFMPLLGYYIATTYIFYYLEDAVKYPASLQGASTFSIIATVVSVLSTLLGGLLSDYFKRRKIFVIFAVSIIAISMFLLAFFHIWQVVLVAAAILGLGFGAYMAVDVAIVTLVLPSAKSRAKDMGIVNIASTLPHSLAPVLAGFIIALTHSYTFLYAAAGIFLLLGIFTVIPIKSVR